MTYVYDKGGQITEVYGTKKNDKYEYVQKIGYDEFGQRVYIKYGDGSDTRYTYDPERRWLSNIYSRDSWYGIFQNLNYNFDKVGNVLGIDNYANGTSQSFTYDDLYRLTKAEGTAQSLLWFKENDYKQTFSYDSIGNITEKISYNRLTTFLFDYTLPGAMNYDHTYQYEWAKPHAPSQVGDYEYFYDANGNLINKVYRPGHNSKSNLNTVDDLSTVTSSSTTSTDTGSSDSGSGSGSGSSGTSPYGNQSGMSYGSENLSDLNPGKQGSYNDGSLLDDYVWDEENRLIRADDKLILLDTYFLYDYQGNRTAKWCAEKGETVYVNEYYQLQNRSIITKHIFVGTTRIASKLAYYTLYDSYFEKHNIYTYHPDHLGSSNYITDYAGNVFEHMEYTPYGESWIDDGSNISIVPYKFTGKELDAETGLYYYGARYLDPVLSRWISTDPAMEKYLPEATVDDEAIERNKQLPGQGGVFNPINLNVYAYSSNNPVLYVDPDGLSSENTLQRFVHGALVTTTSALGAAMGTIIGGGGGAAGGTFVAPGVGTIGGGAAGAVAGATLGAATGAAAGELLWQGAKAISNLMQSSPTGGGGGSNKPTSKTFGKPIETTVGGKKVQLRVDAEPDAGKIQIQAGHGKSSIIDIRIDPNKPIAQQVPKNLNLTKAQTQELTKNIQKAADWLKN